MTKYNFEIADAIVSADVNRLTNQLWKLIPMREHEENWLMQLDSLIVEIAGLNEIFKVDGSLLKLLSKLEGLKVTETEFYIYRKTVFESISLLREMIK